jgi:hypothetical protein
MGYVKLRQAFLLGNNQARKACSLANTSRQFDVLWIGLRSKVFKKETTLAWTSVCLFSAIWYLSWVFGYTHNVSFKPLLFWITWFIVAFGYLGWWMALVELFVFQRQLRDRAKNMLRELDAKDWTKIDFVHESGLKGVYRVLFGPSPSPFDTISQHKIGQNQKLLKTLFAFREIQYRLLMIKNQVSLLLIGSLLLLGAVAAYPFTSEMMFRSFGVVSVIVLAGSVCLIYWKLERDEFLSPALGTEPNEFELNFNNLSIFATYGGIGLLVLISQFVPGSWLTVGRFLGPIMHMGH